MAGQAAGPDDRLLRVQLLLAADRGGEARAELEGLVAERPDEAEALATLGRLYQEAGDAKGARGLFERAAAGRPRATSPPCTGWGGFSWRKGATPRRSSTSTGRS